MMKNMKNIFISASLDGSYKLEYNFTYEGANISTGCNASYVEVIRNTLNDLSRNNNITVEQFCPYVKGNISLGAIIIKEAEKKVKIYNLLQNI